MLVWGLFDSLFSTMTSLVFLLVVVATMLVVILENRNPYKTLAWILVLFFLPVVGLVAYFFFGRDTRKERLISKRGFERLTKYPMMEFQQQESHKSMMEKHLLMRFCYQVNGALPFGGNSVRMHTDGYAMIQALLRAIANAKHHIHMQFYIFEDDALGRMVRDALIEKAQEGVEVRVLYDDVGCWKVHHSFYDEMRESGIEVRGFLKVRFPRFTSKVNYRNHRKVIVIDGCIGFIGGMNIALRCWTLMVMDKMN